MFYTVILILFVPGVVGLIYYARANALGRDNPCFKILNPISHQLTSGHLITVPASDDNKAFVMAVHHAMSQLLTTVERERTPPPYLKKICQQACQLKERLEKPVAPGISASSHGTNKPGLHKSDSMNKPVDINTVDVAIKADSALRQSDQSVISQSSTASTVSNSLPDTELTFAVNTVDAALVTHQPQPSQSESRMNPSAKSSAVDAGYTETTSEPVVESEFASQFMLVISQIYKHHGISVDDIAGYFHMSARQLQRRVKADMNISPVQYLKDYRLSKAEIQLMRGEQPTAIAFAVGFDTYDSFSRAFKEKFGLSPRHYVTQQRAAMAQAESEAEALPS